MKLSWILLWVPVGALVVLSACVATTTDVDRLQDSLNQVQKGQADLVVKMEELDRTLNILNERLTESQSKMTSLTQKLDDAQAQMVGRMESIASLLASATTQATVQTPSQVYKTAYADYLAGKTDLAISEFKNFLETYPNSDLKDQARFYLADSFLNKKDFNRARETFDQVLADSRVLRAPALLKRAYALEGAHLSADQKLTLETLLKEFPNSQEAQIAQQILRAMDEPAKPKSKAKTKSPAKKNKK